MKCNHIGHHRLGTAESTRSSINNASWLLLHLAHTVKLKPSPELYREKNLSSFPLSLVTKKKLKWNQTKNTTQPQNHTNNLHVDFKVVNAMLTIWVFPDCLCRIQKLDSRMIKKPCSLIIEAKNKMRRVLAVSSVIGQEIKRVCGHIFLLTNGPEGGPT